MNKTEELKAAFSRVRKLDEAIDRKLDEHFLMALIDTTKWELEELRRRRAEAAKQLPNLGRQSNVVPLFAAEERNSGSQPLGPFVAPFCWRSTFRIRERRSSEYSAPATKIKGSASLRRT